METRNLNIANFLNNSCEILDNSQLVALLGGDGTTTPPASAGNANDGTIAPDPKIWIKG